MTINKRYFGIFQVALLVTLSVFVSGCNINSDEKKINGEKKENLTVNTVAKVEKNEKEKTQCDTTVSSGYCMSLGVLDENLVINGPERNESEISIVKGKIVFPQGAIRSVCIGSWSRKEEAFNPEKSELDGLVKEIENTKVIAKLPEKAFGCMPRIQTKLLFLNSHGEFRTISVTSYGNGYHELCVEKDDSENFSQKVFVKLDSGDKKKRVFLQSYELEKIIKKCISFEKNDDIFEKISKAEISVDEQDVSIRLRDKEIEMLKNYVKTRKKTVDNPCGHDNYFKCTLADGSNFHFSVCLDGESLSTDNQVYTIDNSVSCKICDLLKSIKKRMNK